LTLGKLGTVLLDEWRWRILAELAKGEALPVMELVRRTRRTRNSVQKNMSILKDAKLVVQTYGHLYRLAPEMSVSADGTHLDLGYCVIRVDRLAS
jgi:predicted transcriptional regulator